MGNTNLSRAIQTCSSPKNPGQSCGARTRRGTVCQKPPLNGKTRCRLHGGGGRRRDGVGGTGVGGAGVGGTGVGGAGVGGAGVGGGVHVMVPQSLHLSVSCGKQSMQQDSQWVLVQTY